MNFKEMRDWSVVTCGKSNNELLELGVKADKFSKVRNILKEGIAVRCGLVLANTEKNNKYISEIEDYIKRLSEYGINPAKQNLIVTGEGSSGKNSEKNSGNNDKK